MESSVNPPTATDSSFRPTTRVVVLGSGYAGIHAACELVRKKKQVDDLEIILLSNTDHLLYVTMIYEVVAGNLAPSSVRQSVRTMLSQGKIRFIQGTVDAVDADNQTVNYISKDARPQDESQNRELTLSYDYLISAIGSETNFRDTPGAAEHAYTLKTLPDAQKLKNKLINHFEQADLETDVQEQRELLSIVIVGGGPTGVTLAAKIADLFNDELAEAFPNLISLAHITILEGGDRVLDRIGGWFSEQAHGALKEKQCVDVVTNHYVDEVRANGVSVGDKFIRSQCVIWVAGVKAREFGLVSREPIDQDKPSRRIIVTEALHTPSYKNIFVAGDQGWVDRGEQGPYPMRAQFAVRQGRQAAVNVIRSMRGEELENFYWADKGLVVSVGEGRTYAQIGGFQFSGLLATMAYKSVYLMSTIGVRAKLRAILEWGMNVFLPRDVSEL